ARLRPAPVVVQATARIGTVRPLIVVGALNPMESGAIAVAAEGRIGGRRMTATPERHAIETTMAGIVAGMAAVTPGMGSAARIEAAVPMTRGAATGSASGLRWEVSVVVTGATGKAAVEVATGEVMTVEATTGLANVAATTVGGTAPTPALEAETGEIAGIREIRGV
ncbi:unnamed protein product, partial [Polarella glacialis]